MIISYFITPSLLREIHASDLIKILEPLKPLLESKGLWLDDKSKKFPISELVNYLRNNVLPRDVEDAFFFISALMREENSEAVLIAVMNAGGDINGDNSQLAAKLWFLAPDKCKEIIALSESKRQRKFNYYSPSQPIASPISTLSTAALDRIKDSLGEWFDKEAKSKFVVILQEDNGDSIFVSVFHGSTLKRKDTINDSGSSVISYRDKIADMVRIDKKNGSIGICLRHKSSRIELRYLKIFKAAFAPNSEYVSETKFTLEPLLNIKMALSRGIHASKILNFRLKEATAYIRGQRMNIKGSCPEVFWEEFPMEKVVFKNAKFGVMFLGDSTEHELIIAPPQGAEYPEQSKYDSELEDLLKMNGFIVENTVEEYAEEAIALGK